MIVIDNSFNRCFFDVKSGSHIFYKIPSDEKLHEELLSVIIDAIDECKLSGLNSKMVKVVKLADFDLIQYRGNELRFIQKLSSLERKELIM